MKRVVIALPAALLWLGPAVLAPPLPLRAQTANGGAPGYSFPFKNREGLLVARFTGATATPVSLAQPTLLNVDQFRVETFRPNGTPDLIGTAPHCLLNAATKDASSSGPLTVTQADGQFTLQGEGFQWNHETGTLTISNRFHMTFHSAEFNATAVSPVQPAKP